MRASPAQQADAALNQITNTPAKDEINVPIALSAFRDKHKHPEDCKRNTKIQ